MLIKCPNSTNLSWKISGCMTANYFFEHSKFGKRLLCYISILLFSLSFVYGFILLLITREVIQHKMVWCSLKLMKLPGRGRRISREHTRYVRLMYVPFKLCVHVHVMRTKCSECYRVRAPCFKNPEVGQKFVVAVAVVAVVPSIPVK